MPPQPCVSWESQMVDELLSTSSPADAVCYNPFSGLCATLADIETGGWERSIALKYGQSNLGALLLI